MNEQGSSGVALILAILLAAAVAVLIYMLFTDGTVDIPTASLLADY